MVTAYTTGTRDEWRRLRATTRFDGIQVDVPTHIDVFRVSNQVDTQSHLVIGLELTVVREPNERFQSDNTNERCVNQMIRQSAGCVVIAQRPSIAAEHDVCTISMARTHGIGQTHDLERYLLFCCAARLLPLQRDEDRAAVFLCERIDLVCAAAAPCAYSCLRLIAVLAARERRHDHRFEYAARVRVARRHTLRVPIISRAGVRSPVQLIRRGASKNVTS